MNDKILSIILVSKNNSLDVKYTLDSLNGVEKLNYEILVIDSSGDLLTKDLLSEYRHFPNIKYFWTPPKGIYNAMNIGLKMSAENSCIWFLNPGDVLLNLDCVYQVIDKISDPKIDFCIIQSVYANKSHINENFFPKKDIVLSLENFVSGNLAFSHQATFVDKKLFDGGILFEENYTIAADYKLQYTLLKHSKGVFIPKLGVEIDVTGVSHQRVFKTLFQTTLILSRDGYFSLLSASQYFAYKICKRLFESIKIRIRRLAK